MRATSKNVFRDLGFGTEDAENLRIRSALMIVLTEHVKPVGIVTRPADAKRSGGEPGRNSTSRQRSKAI